MSKAIDDARAVLQQSLRAGKPDAAAPAATPVPPAAIVAPAPPVTDQTEPPNHIQRFVALYLQYREQGKNAYQQADQILGELLPRMATGQIVTLLDGRTVQLVDNFANSNTTWRSVACNHFELKELKTKKVKDD